MKGFASDNYAGIHPEVLAAIAEANVDHAVAYGEDPWTARAEGLLRDHFGPSARSWLVFNGTGANVLAFRALCRPWQGVICAETAHVNVDEGGAPEAIGGTKLLTLPTPDGKLTPELVGRHLLGGGDEHAVQPRVVSVTQSTELGTRYEPDELRALADHAHANGLLLHVDGSRLANAAAGLGVSLAATTTDVGVDAVSFGGTKNGLLGGEALVLLTDDIGEGLTYLRKQTLQLASKGRFLAAQFIALLEGDLWRTSAAHANAMASRLAAEVRDVPGVTITQRVQANAVFAMLPEGVADRLREVVRFYTWDESTGEVRWMCSWDTTEAEVDAFAAAVADACAARVAAD
ncbi:MAG: low specificity L-threonine aldolase [Solirubrobacterales bacterium]|nr:low specificity L-threonine aldolase [Solirubrobacterales bacterium]